jgi:hypothetical protein
MPGRAEKRRMSALRFQRMRTDTAKAQSQAAFVVIRRLYSECLPLWRSCQRGDCRRHRRCFDNAPVCLKRAWPLLPEAAQDAAIRQVRQGGPRRVAAASETEWSLRRYPPSNFVR